MGIGPIRPCFSLRHSTFQGFVRESGRLPTAW
jgi:hypothetical protein